MVSSHGQAHGFSPNYVITDVYTCPISIETYVEFKKLDMSDLVVHGNNELTDLEKNKFKTAEERDPENAQKHQSELAVMANLTLLDIPYCF